MLDSETIRESLINALIEGNSMPKDYDLDGNRIADEFDWSMPLNQSMHSAASDIIRLIYLGITPTIPQGKNGRLVYNSAMAYAEASIHLYNAILSAKR